MLELLAWLLLLRKLAWTDWVKGPVGILAWVLVLLRNHQPWVRWVMGLIQNQPFEDWVMVHGGIQALAGRGIPFRGLGAVGTGHMTVG